MDVNKLHFLAKLQTNEGVKYSFDVYRKVNDGSSFQLNEQGYVRVFESGFRYDSLMGLVSSLGKGYLGAFKLEANDGDNPNVVFLRKEECEGYVGRAGLKNSDSFLDFNGEDTEFVRERYPNNVFYDGLDGLVGSVIEESMLKEIVVVEDVDDGDKRA
jgi:hypothetical protein